MSKFFSWGWGIIIIVFVNNWLPKCCGVAEHTHKIDWPKNI